MHEAVIFTENETDSASYEGKNTWQRTWKVRGEVCGVL